MGIVAYCPSGHRMKVKDYLAGRRGICPTCGARFRIPQPSIAVPSSGGAAALPDRVGASDRDQPLPSAPAAAIPITATAGGRATATVVSLDPAAAAGLPELLMLADPATIALVDDQLPMETSPQVDPDPTADLEIDQDEDAGGDDTEVLYWFVAVPGGQPSAALLEPQMVAWLASGQASGREVVWRSDWPEWKPIAAAFPDRFSAWLPDGGRS